MMKMVLANQPTQQPPAPPILLKTMTLVIIAIMALVQPVMALVVFSAVLLVTRNKYGIKLTVMMGNPATTTQSTPSEMSFVGDATTHHK